MEPQQRGHLQDGYAVSSYPHPLREERSPPIAGKPALPPAYPTRCTLYPSPNPPLRHAALAEWRATPTSENQWKAPRVPPPCNTSAWGDRRGVRAQTGRPNSRRPCRKHLPAIGGGLPNAETQSSISLSKLPYF